MKIEPAQLRDLAKRYTAAWCSKDPESVAASYSPNGSLSVNGDVPAVGRSAISEVAQEFMTAFPDLEVQDGRRPRSGRPRRLPLDTRRYQHGARRHRAASSHQRVRGMGDRC